MQTITLATQKGGSGKSTLAIGLAVAALHEGERVFIVEVDRQGTISRWSARRPNPQPGVEPIFDGAELSRFIDLLASKRYTLTIIDTPGSEHAVATDAIRLADLCLIPARPSLADIEATQATFKTVRRYEKKFAFILNQAPPRHYRAARAADDLSTLGVLAQPFIVQRTDHQDALAAGLAVHEFAPTGRAAEEIGSLWTWVKNKLHSDLPAHPQASGSASAEATMTRPANPVDAVVSGAIRFATLPWLAWPS